MTHATHSIRWALAGLSLAMLLSSLGTSIANVALPTLMGAFDATFQQVQWIVLAYLVAITSTIVFAGRLGDRIGRRRLLRAGLVVFTVASVLAGLAPALWILIVARVAQGLGAAVMMALTVAFVSDVVPEGKTGSAMGLLGTTSAIGTVLGPSLGGILIDSLGWRAIFFVGVPLGAVAMFLAHRHLPDDRSTHGERTSAPRLRLAMFRDATLGSSLVANLLVSMVLMATLVVGPFYLSLALRLDAGLVGLVMSIGPIMAAATGIPAGRLVDRFGSRRMTLQGLGGIAVGSIVLAVLPDSLGIPGYVAPIVVITIHYALFQAANNTGVMQHVGPDQRGVASGMLSLSRNLGLIAGTSVMGTVFALAAGTNDIVAAPPEAVAAGMRVTFMVAAALLGVALVIVAGARARLAWALALMLAPNLAVAREPADEENSIRVVGLLQPQLSNNGFFVNRARLGVQGSVLDENLRYLFVTEFGGGDPRLLFLNVDYTFDPDWLTIRVGQFKRPFSRSFIAFASQLSMIDRPMTVGPSVFGDNADIGVMLHNGTARRFEYAVGIFNGTGPNVLPERPHPLLAVRVGYNTAGTNPYSESDLEGGPPRFGIAAAGLVDFDADGDGESFTSGLVDAVFKAHGFSLSSGLYVGTRQVGPRWSAQRLSAVGHHTQVGYVISKHVEPVVRHAFLLPNAQHDIAGGLNLYFRGHAFKWQNFVSVRFSEWMEPQTVFVQSQLSLAF